MISHYIIIAANLALSICMLWKTEMYQLIKLILSILKNVFPPFVHQLSHLIGSSWKRKISVLIKTIFRLFQQCIAEQLCVSFQFFLAIFDCLGASIHFKICLHIYTQFVYVKNRKKSSYTDVKMQVKCILCTLVRYANCNCTRGAMRAANEGYTTRSSLCAMYIVLLVTESL